MTASRRAHRALALSGLLVLGFPGPGALAQGIKVSHTFQSSFSGDVTVFALTPDGTAIVYLADQATDGVPELFRAPVDGSAAPERLHPPLAPGQSVRTFSASSFAPPLVISPLGDRVLYLADAETPGDFGLYSAGLSGSEPPVRLAGGYLSYSFSQARIDAVGQRAIYRASRTSASTEIELHMAPLDGSADAIQLSAPIGFRNVTAFVLSPDGVYAYYLSEDTSTATRLWRVPVDGSGAPELVGHNETARVHWFELAPDGAWVVYAAGNGGGLFGRASNGSGEAVRINDASLNQTAVAGQIPITPDGTRVVYREYARFSLTEHGLYGAPVDGSANPVRLNSASACPRVERHWITPDSTRAVFRGFEADGRACLYSAPLDGSAPPVRLHGVLPPFTDVFLEGRMSADSSWVVYSADAELDERRELYATRIDGTQPPVRLNPTGGPSSVSYRWVVSGERAVFAGDYGVDDLYRLYVAPLDGSTPALPLSPPPVTTGNSLTFHDLVVTADGTTAIYVNDQVVDEAYEAWSVPLDASRPSLRLNEPMRWGPVYADVYTFEFAADGTRVYGANGGVRGIHELFSANAAREPRVLPLDPEAPWNYHASAFVLSNDRRTAIYRARASDGWHYLHAAPVDASAPAVRISPLGFGIDQILHVSQDDEWVLCARSNGSLQRVELDGGPAVLLTARNAVPETRVSADGEWVVFRTSANQGTQIVSVPAGGGEEIVLEPERAKDGFRITNDAASVLFVPFAGPHTGELLRRPIDGSAPPVVLSAPGHQVGRIEPSLDGLGVVYRAKADAAAPFELFGVPLDQSFAPVRLSGPLVAGGNVTEDFVISAGVPHLVYTADQTTDSVFELYSARIGSGTSVRLNAPLTAGGSVPTFRVSPDGAWVVYNADQEVDDRFELHAVPIDGSRPALRLHAALGNGDVRADYHVTASGRVFFRAHTLTSPALELFESPVDASSPARRLNSPLVAGGEVTGFRVNPDGSSVLYRADQEQDDVFELYETLLTRPVRRMSLR